MTYLIVNILILVFPLAYWAWIRTVPLRPWMFLIGLGLAFDLVEVNLLRIYTFPEPTLLWNLPLGEYLFIVGVPLRALAFYELGRQVRGSLRRD